MDLIRAELLVKLRVNFKFIARVKEEIDCIADHAGDLPERALVLISLDVGLIEKRLEASCRALLDHELHEHSLSVDRLSHFILVNDADFFAEDSFEQLHQG